MEVFFPYFGGGQIRDDPLTNFNGPGSRIGVDDFSPVDILGLCRRGPDLFIERTRITQVVYLPFMTVLTMMNIFRRIDDAGNENGFHAANALEQMAVDNILGGVHRMASSTALTENGLPDGRSKIILQ